MPYEYSDAKKQQLVDDARKAGVPQPYIDSFLPANGGVANGDYNRLQSSYNSQHEGQGQDSMRTGGAWAPNPSYAPRSGAAPQFIPLSQLVGGSPAPGMAAPNPMGVSAEAIAAEHAGLVWNGSAWVPVTNGVQSIYGY